MASYWKLNPNRLLINIALIIGLALLPASCADTIPTTEDTPSAVAGDDQTAATIGDVIVVDGSSSFDPKSRTLTYSWAFGQVPPVTGSALTAPTKMNSSGSVVQFTPDVNGNYVLELTVSNGKKSDTDTVVIKVGTTQ